MSSLYELLSEQSRQTFEEAKRLLAANDTAGLTELTSASRKERARAAADRAQAAGEPVRGHEEYPLRPPAPKIVSASSLRLRNRHDNTEVVVIPTIIGSTVMWRLEQYSRKDWVVLNPATVEWEEVDWQP